MTRQEVKYYLLRYRQEKKRIRRLAEQIEELRTRKAYPGSPSLDAMPHGSNPSDLSDYASRLDELERRLGEEQVAADRAALEVIETINRLADEDEKSVLTLYYVRGYRWDRVAVEVSYSWRHVLRLRDQAVKHLARILTE